PMLLINLGCFLRVTLQISTDWHPVFFKLTGVSGVLEWLGFALWAAHLLAVMLGVGRYTPQSSQVSGSRWGSPQSQILPEHRVAQVLDWYPQLAPLFVANGFDMVTRPFMRETIATQVTLAQACGMKQVQLKTFIEQLNAAVPLAIKSPA